MKVVDYYWDHPELKKYVRVMPEGRYLFRQGDPGQTMFIVVKGVVQLVAEREGRLYVASILEAGQFLGEKAILGDAPHKRAFSAQAKTPLTVLELGLKDIDKIQKKVPELMTDILKRSFQIAAERLDRATQMMAILRSTEPASRLILTILYIAATAGRAVPEGTEILLTADNIHYHTSMPVDHIELGLKELVAERLLVRKSNQCYVIRSEKTLRAYIPTLERRFSQGKDDSVLFEIPKIA